MANVKEVLITGELPFNIAEDLNVRNWLGILNQPCYGLRIQYGSERYIPNDHGGKTATYQFVISGREAVWVKPWMDFVDSLKKAGATITEAKMADIEDHSGWFSLEE